MVLHCKISFLITRSVSTSQMAKYYAVRNGRRPGIYSTWDECKQQVDGFKGAVYKKFGDLKEATAFARGAGSSSSMTARPSVTNQLLQTTRPVPNVAINDLKRNAPSHSKMKDESYNPTHKRQKASYYAVNYPNGESSVFTKWADCQKAVRGSKGITFKKFDSLDSAKRFTCGSDDKAFSEEQKSTALDHITSRHGQHRVESHKTQEVKYVFMDGSYLPTLKRCGYGVYFGPNDPRNLSEPVTRDFDSTDSFVGEVYATRAALSHIMRDIEKFQAGDSSELLPKYVLATDSETVINILTKYAPTWTDKDFEQRSAGLVLKEAYDKFLKVQSFFNLHSKVFDDHRFEIKWVKGHSGIEGNEAADQLAKAGALKSKT